MPVRWQSSAPGRGFAAPSALGRRVVGQYQTCAVRQVSGTAVVDVLAGLEDTEPDLVQSQHRERFEAWGPSSGSACAPRSALLRRVNISPGGDGRTPHEALSVLVDEATRSTRLPGMAQTPPHRDAQGPGGLLRAVRAHPYLPRLPLQRAAGVPCRRRRSRPPSCSRSPTSRAPPTTLPSLSPRASPDPASCTREAAASSSSWKSRSCATAPPTLKP